MSDPLLDIACTTLDGRTVTLGQYGARALLVVNTASRCGFTPQYQGLEALWQQYRERGLMVLGFPCNQFGHQEPEGEAAIAAFCERNYGVSFPLFAKVEVNGPGAHPLFAALKQLAPGVLGSRAIKWNFTKFLLDGEGCRVRRFSPRTEPAALRPAIESLLG
ncbi:glutathione peroxidase [Stutzerimonas azotifigens]|uniref:glutathione peroxidase n=1 Tax=Stutzerimonas azotifigens TaxID=291995 RepID=UPI00048434F6|nr:glutathione peroxidase [Stutzerimonas azotifigens]